MHDMIQGDLFSSVLEHKQITKPIRLIEFFAGIGSQFKALKQLTDKVESYKICEWSIHSIKAYNAIHVKDFTDYSKELSKEQLIVALRGVSSNYNEPMSDEQLNRKPIEWLKDMYNNCKATHNLINIMDVHGKDLEIVDTDKYEYILTYSFPCQDLSLAGLMKGMDVSQAQGGTRSGLLWEVERILDELERESLPQILVMENVPEVIGANNIESFKKWELKLESLGYTNYVKVINAKDFGIPQNRRRCFMISILGDYAYDFPINMKLEYKLKDMLEPVVDEKYYISKKMIDYLNKKVKQGWKKDFLTDDKGVSSCICNPSRNQINDNYIAIPEATKQGYAEAHDGDGVYINRPHQKRGVVQKGMIQTIKTTSDDVGVIVSENLKQELCDKMIENGTVKENDVIRHSYTNNRIKDNKKPIENNLIPTLDTRCDCLGVVVKNEPKLIGGIGEKKSNGGTQFYQQDRVYDANGIAMCHPANIPDGSYKYQMSDLRIRKLTPKETYRLMGFQDKDYQACADIGQSNATIYHQAGDSIVTTVLIALFSPLFNEISNHKEIISKYIKEIKDE